LFKYNNMGYKLLPKQISIYNTLLFVF